MFWYPEVLLVRDCCPIAVLRSPDVLFLRDPLPIAVLVAIPLLPRPTVIVDIFASSEPVMPPVTETLVPSSTIKPVVNVVAPLNFAT